MKNNNQSQTNEKRSCDLMTSVNPVLVYAEELSNRVYLLTI